MACIVERLSRLEGIPFVRSAFLAKCPDIDVNTDRETALRRLRDRHNQLRQEAGFGGMAFLRAEQVHQKEVAVIKSATESKIFPGADGLITDRPNLCLGIYVADCAAVFLIDRSTKVIALLHSGKKGTELGIVPHAIRHMRAEFGSSPRDIVMQIAPCIRPPHYEVDFAKEIVRQAQGEGVHDICDEGICTASDPERYYSYRREKGQTGRMLALLALLPDATKI